MAKDPVLPLYYNDLTTSTQDWTDEEFGAYVRLLIHQWRQGGLPKDYQRLTRIATSLDTNWPLLKEKFKEVDGLLKNPVMEEIRLKRDKHKEKQRENVLKRYQNPTKQPTKKLPLEDEIEKENEIENIIEIGTGEKFVSIKKKYVGDKITKIYNLMIWFEQTGQLDALLVEGYNDFEGFMKSRPAGMFDDQDHLYHAFLNFHKKDKPNGKQFLTKVQQQQANNLQALRDQSAAVFGKQQ